MSGCPSDLQLEEILAAGEAAPLAGHAASCAACGERLAEMRRLGEEFRREVYPLTVDAVVGSTRRRAPRWLLLSPLPLAAAAAVALVVFTREPPPDYVGIKGGELALAVFADADRGAHAVADGEQVPAAAALRFQVRSSVACRLWLVSVDGAGQVSRLYPAEGEAPPVGAGPLPGGAVLDGRPGPERIFAICSPAQVAFGEVERAARAAASGGEAGVRGARQLRGLPSGALQATILLEKHP